MNRNVESHFATLPSAEIQRSTFDRSHSYKTSFNFGELIPFYIDEVMPGDTFSIDTSIVARMQTLLTPIMDNCYIDTYYFFTPLEILWTHAKQFFGENTNSAWTDSVTYSIPQIAVPNDTSPNNGWLSGTIADYLGIPINVPNNPSGTLTVNALPFRCYAMVADQWFRDQNLTDPLVINLGDSTVTGSNGSTYQTDVALGGKPFIAAKFHDEFTSCLPAPQKLDTPVGLFGKNTYAPVVARDPNLYKNNKELKSTTNAYPIIFRASNDIGSTASPVSIYPSSGQYDQASVVNSSNTISTDNRMYPANLFANMYGVGTINELRLAFSLQRYYEKMARSGSRYREYIQVMFGVTSPDQRTLIPEYLGGHRFPLSIHQVANTSQDTGSYLGDLGAMSNTSDVHSDFTKSFSVHGYVIGVMVARYDHSYSQGLDRLWTRKAATDFYVPTFANIGEQPLRKDAIYMQSSVSDNEGVFGYQEAWYEYRYKKNLITGEMRPGITNSLATWHLGDYYTSLPYLSDGWIREDKSNVDRVLAVTSNLANQIFADIYISNKCTRPMPMYSIPGLIDHH